MEAVWSEEGEIRFAIWFDRVRTVAQKGLNDDGEIVASVVSTGRRQRMHPAQISIANLANFITGARRDCDS